jgi:hypothetical protein
VINSRCEHVILKDLGLHMTECRLHSRPRDGVAFWGYSTQPQPAYLCPCGMANRFSVVGETASISWMEAADVVMGISQVTTRDAVRVAARICGLPGCPLVTVAAGQNCTVLCTRTELVPVDNAMACGLCVYPWLVAGRRLADLT